MLVSSARGDWGTVSLKAATPPKSDRPGALPESSEHVDSRFPIVGIGASAGGLEAFTELFENLPPDTGMAFVLVQHLAPSHGSRLPELLSSKTPMTVTEAEDGTCVAPNIVYVIPAAQDITIEGGVLKLTSRPLSGQHLPIDSFFASLALDRKTEAVAVVLSGTAADGAAGVRAVKSEGGTTFAQDPGTAKYPGMPESAIATGAVDFVLPLPELAQRLLVIARRGNPAAPSLAAPGAPVISAEDPHLVDVLDLVRSATKADFSQYKQNTIMRRISRRMMMQHTDSVDAYLDLLRHDPLEVEALYQDLLIRVTSFFRQPHVFETLKGTVFPQIAEAQAEGQVRFWVPGCASGEEAYSLAMAWAEFRGEDHVDKASFQIFASDINQQVIDKARSAVYPVSIVSDVTPERLARFFSRVDQGYQIAKNIRETCVFARHDLTRDPPFSRIDLISLRNVLIYLGPILQRRVMPALHFALRPGGFLMLGESESVGGFTDLFRLLDKKGKIYVRSGARAGVQPPSPPAPAQGAATPRPAPTQPNFDPSLEADKIVLDAYAPVGVIVDADLQIRRFRGHTGPYLEPGPGRVSFDLLRMAREGLAAELGNAVRDARKTAAPVRRRAIRIVRDGRVVAVGFDVIPIKAPSGEASFLVLFRDEALQEKATPSAEPMHVADTGGHDPGSIAELERELSEMREYARAVLEDKESANEELRSANEELQSTNEELQSVNEELETASEEVQSANEELRTLNDELRAVNDRLAAVNEELTGKNVELRETNAALDSREGELRDARDHALAVLDTVREPLLTLGPDSHVISASPPFYAMFKTNAHRTLGRSVFELGQGRLDIPELREAIHHALVVGTDFQDFVVDRDLVGLGHRTMLLSGRHIHYGGGAPQNVLLAIEDITERSRGQALSDALDRINLTMVSTSDYDELLERAMTEAAQALGSVEAALVIPADGSWITRFSQGASWATAGASVSDDVARQFSGLAVGQRAVVSTSSRGKSDDLSPRASRTQSVRVPLISRDGIVGAISFGRSGYDAAFSEAELDFVDKLAPALSLALGNAEAYANEHRIAEVLQTSLLKPLLPVPGMEIGLAYRPAHRAERVGGDFYDLFSLADGRVVAVVGDVSGKGVQAASLTETVRATLRTLTSLALLPAQVLKKANEILMEQLPRGQFVTVLLAIVDVASARVVVSSAGHPPLVVCGEKARFLEVLPGTPLGAVTSDYSEAEFELLPTETMVLYTDGLIEARRGSDFFGEHRLIGALAGEGGTNVQRMVESLVSKVTEYAGGRLADDLAVIAVHLV